MRPRPPRRIRGSLTGTSAGDCRLSPGSAPSCGRPRSPTLTTRAGSAATRMRPLSVAAAGAEGQGGAGRSARSVGARERRAVGLFRSRSHSPEQKVRRRTALIARWHRLSSPTAKRSRGRGPRIRRFRRQTRSRIRPERHEPRPLERWFCTAVACRQRQVWHGPWGHLRRQCGGLRRKRGPPIRVCVYLAACTQLFRAAPTLSMHGVHGSASPLMSSRQ